MLDQEQKEYKIRYRVLVEIEGEFFDHTNLTREEYIKEVNKEMMKGGFIDFANDKATVKDILNCQIINEFERIPTGGLIKKSVNEEDHGIFILNVR